MARTRVDVGAPTAAAIVAARRALPVASPVIASASTHAQRRDPDRPSMRKTPPGSGPIRSSPRARARLPSRGNWRPRRAPRRRHGAVPASSTTWRSSSEEHRVHAEKRPIFRLSRRSSGPSWAGSRRCGIANRWAFQWGAGRRTVRIARGCVDCRAHAGPCACRVMVSEVLEPSGTDSLGNGPCDRQADPWRGEDRKIDEADPGLIDHVELVRRQ